MLKQNKGLKRNTIDKFYTKDAVAEALIHKITTNIDIDYQNDLRTKNIFSQKPALQNN